MAVGFFAEDEDRLNSSYHSQTQYTATQTPLQSPVSREYLVQAFCEALHRCSIAGKFIFSSIFNFPVKNFFFPIFMSVCCEVLNETSKIVLI